ncbi:MAG: hypothetical protein M3Y52_02025, partial [Actinomycetota bacterium]|nr:hypothetical protein [Actinomycetota bacterium]
PEATTYRLSAGPPLTLHHFDDAIELVAGEAHRATTPPLSDPGPRPAQPPGREPRDFAAAFDS